MHDSFINGDYSSFTHREYAEKKLFTDSVVFGSFIDAVGHLIAAYT